MKITFTPIIYLLLIILFFLRCDAPKRESKEVNNEVFPSIIDLNKLIEDVLGSINPTEEVSVFPFLEKFEHSAEPTSTLFKIFDSTTVSFMTKQNLMFEYTSLLPWKLKKYNLDFRKVYNLDSIRYIGFSVPLFNQNKDSAVIEVNSWGNKLNGNATILVLVKNNDKWIISKKIKSWIE